MTASIALHCAPLRCELIPALGGCIAGLWLGDAPVLRSTPAAALHSVRDAASFPLVPFSNRVGQAILRWAGTDHPLAQNFAPEPHAIHGVGWMRPWSVLEHTPSFALLAYEHAADDAWPFDFDTSQAFKLEPKALEMRLSITNQSRVAAPVGLGWHPYFPKRVGSRVRFGASRRWEPDADMLPTHASATVGLDCDCATLTVDHCFDGWQGAVDLSDAVLTTRITSNLRRLVVYTTPERDTIAIEPVSHVNNAINMMERDGFKADELGVQILQPGETLSCDLRIEVEGSPT